MFEFLSGKTVLVTGGCGSVGHELARQFSLIPGVDHAILSRNEAAQFKLKQLYPNTICFLGDIKSQLEIERVFRAFRPEVVIHGAAVKVVPVAEREMFNTFETNAMGTYHIAKACDKFGVQVAVMIGTDKQCAPVNVYGMSKHLGASIFSDMNRMSDTRFLNVRYGNVLCSRSSLGVIITDQAKAGKDLTLTDGSMTRFFFLIEEGVRLIDMAIKRGFNNLAYDYYGETISHQMCAVKLGDFIHAVADKYGVGVTELGRRPGEKTHEHLLAEYELKDSIIDLNNPYTPFYHPDKILYPYITIPHMRDHQNYNLCQNQPKKVFTSENAPRLSKEQSLEMLEYAYQNTWTH